MKLLVKILSVWCVSSVSDTLTLTPEKLSDTQTNHIDPIKDTVLWQLPMGVRMVVHFFFSPHCETCETVFYGSY